MNTVTTPTKPTYLHHFKTAMGLTVFFSGHDPISVAKQNALFSHLENKMRAGEFEGLYELASLAARVKSHSKGKFILVDKDGEDVVLLHGVPMPPALSEFTLQFVEQGFSTDFIERFWKNLSQNPSPESRESLYAFIEANNLTLTDDGCFIGYRSIRSDWTDHHTGLMDNSIGASPELDRSKVDENPNNTCSRGLHVAAWGYANSYCGGRTIEVKVNPKDVVTVPPDYNQQKMRVCKFTVISEVTEKRDTLVHPNTFADPDDWDTGTLVDDVVDDVIDDLNYDDNVDSEIFVLNVTSILGVNIPKELAQSAGFSVGDSAFTCNKDDCVTIYKKCCKGVDFCSTRTVDSHNSIRLSASVFDGWGLESGESVEATVMVGTDGKYIQIL